MLGNAIEENVHHIEPVNKLLDLFHQQILNQKVLEKDFPYFLRAIQNSKNLDDETLLNHFKYNYRLFRDLPTWLNFSERNVSFTYGSRFHVNMASFLSGRPAMWITHDTRTSEMAEYFQLPHLPMQQAINLSPSEIGAHIDMESFYDNYSKVSNRFNEFLAIAGLPKLEFLS